MDKKDVTIKLVVIGSGDPEVGIDPSHELVTVTFHDQRPNFDTPYMTEQLKMLLVLAMENCLTTVFTEEEWEAELDKDELENEPITCCGCCGDGGCLCEE